MATKKKATKKKATKKKAEKETETIEYTREENPF